MQNSNILIVYDDTCPLCASYTRAVVKTGFITKENRKSFSSISSEYLQCLDTNRCRNKIPVIDIQTKQVWYGIDALLEILGKKMPYIKKMGSIKIIKWVLYKLYKFISYNRRVVVASQSSGNFDCTPNFNVRYRIIFLLFFLLFNSFMLLPIQQYILVNSFFSNATWQQLQINHFFLVALNILLSLTLSQKEALEYLGQVNMLAIIIVLLMVPLVMMNKYLDYHPYNFTIFYLGVLAAFFVKEYYRRMNFAGIIKKHRWIVCINSISILLFLFYLMM